MSAKFEMLAKTIEETMKIIKDGSVEIYKINQQERTRRTEISENAITDRIRIQEQANLLHHKIDMEYSKFVSAMSADEQRKDKLQNLLNSILSSSEELSQQEFQLCIKLLDVISSVGCNVRALVPLNEIYSELLEIKN